MGANTARAAGFTNGSFETGDTTGWTFSPDGFGLNPAAQFDVGIDKVELAGAVPEPETYALMLAGLGALGWVARRRRT